MRKQLSINLRQKKTSQSLLMPRRAQYVKIVFFKQNLSVKKDKSYFTETLKTEPNEDEISYIDDKISKLIEQNDKLTKTLQIKHQRQSSQVCPKNQIIDFKLLYTRMEQLENTIEIQQNELLVLRDRSVAQTERTQERQEKELDSLLQKIDVYGQMIKQQQIEIENYRQLSDLNQRLQMENDKFRKAQLTYETKINQFQQCQNEVEGKIVQGKKLIKENDRLTNMIEEQSKNFDQRYECMLKSKDQQVIELLQELETLASYLKIEEQENKYLRDLKIAEMKLNFKSVWQKDALRVKTEQSVNVEDSNSFSMNNIFSTTKHIDPPSKRLPFQEKQNQMNSISSILSYSKEKDF